MFIQSGRVVIGLEFLMTVSAMVSCGFSILSLYFGITSSFCKGVPTVDIVSGVLGQGSCLISLYLYVYAIVNVVSHCGSCPRYEGRPLGMSPYISVLSYGPQGVFCGSAICGAIFRVLRRGFGYQAIGW